MLSISGIPSIEVGFLVLAPFPAGAAVLDRTIRRTETVGTTAANIVYMLFDLSVKRQKQNLRFCTKRTGVFIFVHFF
jgi:hypothetical protein